MWFNWIEGRNTPKTRREKHVLWVLHPLKCAPNWNRIFVSSTCTKTLLNCLSKITIPIPNWNTTYIKRLILCIKVVYVWFNWIEETNTPNTRRKKHVLWLLHPLKCATADVKKIVLQTLLYFIKRYGTFLQGIVIIIIFFGEFVYGC